MIVIRDDDVLIRSSSWKDPLERFKQIHRWICEAGDKVIHVPTILVKEIQEFPESIEFIKEETKYDRMRPQLHGLEHIDYGKLSYEQVCEHLKTSKDWMIENLSINPTKWMTPWGAGEAPGQSYLWEAAKSQELQLVSCANIHKLPGRYGIVQQLTDGHEPLKFLEGKDILVHWWEGGLRLKRVLEAIKYNSWNYAAEVNKDWWNK